MLRRQKNRPFSVQNIVDALQKDSVKKTATERALASLVQKGTVSKKEYGKVKLFILAQDKLELPDPDEISRVEDEVKFLTAKLCTLDENVAMLKAKAAHLSSQLTLNEAIQKFHDLDSEVAKKEEKLKTLGDGTKLMTKEGKAEVERSYFRSRTAWKKQKRIVKNIIDQIGEASGKKAAELYEEIGIDTDESAKVELNSFPDIANPDKPQRRPVKRQRQQ